MIFSMTTKRISTWAICLAFVLPVPLLAQTTLEKEYKSVVQQMTRQFWSEMQVKLSLLPSNYITRDSQSFREYISTEGCKKNSGVEEPKAAISYHYTQSKQQTQYSLRYIGCYGGDAFYEDISIQPAYSDPKSHLKSLILGERSFVADKNHTRKLYAYSDRANTEVVRVESYYSKAQASTKFIATNKLISEVVVNFNENTIKVYAYSFTIRHKFLSGREISMRITHSSNPLVHQVELSSSGPKKYSFISKSLHEQSEKTFNNYFAQVVLKDIKSSINKFFSIFQHYFPKTETASSGLANKRLLNELIVMDQKLNTASPLDINFVQIRLKSYIQAIQDGTLTIIDKRPE